MHPMMNIAVRAARRAGDVIARAVDNVGQLEVNSKGKNDFVTEVDARAEQEIIQTIRKSYPSHRIMAEESGLTPGDEYTWIIDPLDGTANFLHGFPQFSVSIAVMHKGKLEQGVVYDPMRQELFTATRGAGAMLNNRRLRVRPQTKLDGALLATGFPFKIPQHFDAYMSMFRSLFTEIADMRRPGSAALDLAYVAAGRVDGFWEIGLNEWDMAAGALLVQEAGGLATDFTGGDNFLGSGNIIAGHTRLVTAIEEKIRPFVTDSLKSGKKSVLFNG